MPRTKSPRRRRSPRQQTRLSPRQFGPGYHGLRKSITLMHPFRHIIQTVDPAQLRRGIEVEKEHTDDVQIAMGIAMDHLAELDDYYTHLDNMETMAKLAHKLRGR